MKIIECNKGSYSASINFVDDNNVLVGFEMDQSCCEDFGWYFEFSDGSRTEDCDKDIDLDGFQFDSNFHKISRNDYDYEQSATFRLTNGDEEIELVLYNHHNGYYSHGFKIEEDGKTIIEGSI